MIILPSIASADQLALGEALVRLKNWEYLHIDIEDGNFVPNITFGLKTVRRLVAAAGGKRTDVHLLVTNPVDYLDALAETGVQMVSAHIESLVYPMVFLNRCRSLGMSPGLALNIATPVSALEPFLPILDYILVMTAEPDGQGERFYPPVRSKVAEALKCCQGTKKLLIDGGLDLEQLQLFSAMGVDEAVLGRAAFRTPEPYENLREMHAKLMPHIGQTAAGL